jgi:hypothetical protein
MTVPYGPAYPLGWAPPQPPVFVRRARQPSLPRPRHFPRPVRARRLVHSHGPGRPPCRRPVPYSPLARVALTLRQPGQGTPLAFGCSRRPGEPHPAMGVPRLPRLPCVVQSPPQLLGLPCRIGRALPAGCWPLCHLQPHRSFAPAPLVARARLALDAPIHRRQRACLGTCGYSGYRQHGVWPAAPVGAPPCAGG